MADTIAVMNDGRIEQAGSADRALRAPAHRVRRELPRRLEPHRRRRSLERAADVATVETARRRASARAARRAIGRRRPARVRVGVRPEKIALVPADAGVARRAATSLRGHRRPSPSSSASRSSTSCARAGGEELTVIAQNRDGARAASRSGPAARSLLDLGPAAHLRRRQGATHDRPRRRARPRAQLFDDAERLSRRALPRPRAAPRRSALTAAAGACLAACGGVEGDGREAATTGDTADGQPPEDVDRRPGRSPTGRCTSTRRRSRPFDKEYGGKVKYIEDDQRQRRVLRQGPPAARARASRSAATSSR